MVLIKVKYDAYNRTFKPVAGELLKTLEDGEIYMLIADVRLEDVKPGEADGNLPFREDRAVVPPAARNPMSAPAKDHSSLGLY